MGIFRKSEADPLAVTMAGVKLGNRVLFVGMRDPVFIAALATKAGLTGRACAFEADEARAARGAAEIERAGALVEATRAAWQTLPYEEGSFDVAVARDVLPTLSSGERAGCLREVQRVLRPGGRIVVIEPAPRHGLGAMFGRTPIDPAYVAAGGPLAALQAAGFVAARVLAERDGVVFVEGAKGGSGTGSPA